MNIPPTIRAAANRRGLGEISTGGGMDYIHRHLPDGHEVILTGTTQDGSPPYFGSPANLVIFDDGDWRTGVTIPFGRVREALDTMAKMDGLGPLSREE